MKLDGKPHIRFIGGKAMVEYRVPLAKALLPAQSTAQLALYPYGGSVGEWEPGGWQRNLGNTAQESALRFSAVYRCIDLICGDISKLRPKLMQEQADGTKKEVTTGSPFLRVLRKPNHYQTWQQFAEEWQKSKQTSGNAYILKVRDNRGDGEGRGVVRALYVLDPMNVRVFVSDQTADVFYALGKDLLASIRDDQVYAPASEIIHDRAMCFWHPLIGVGPLYAAAAAALQGANIQADSSQFFANMSRPSGILMVPTGINQTQAEELKSKWNTGFSGDNLGKVAVLTGGTTYQPMVIPPADAQMAEQMQLSVGDVARAFGVPPYKLGLQTNVTFSNAGQLNQDYYSQLLQKLIFAMQDLLKYGLELPSGFSVWLNLDDLLLMDPAGRAEADTKEIAGGILKPDEGRARRNLPPVAGGNAVYMQQQNYSLAALEKRDAQDDPFASKAPPPAAPAATPDEESADKAARELIAKAMTTAALELVTRTPPDV